MGLLDDTNHSEYYSSNTFGGYQFTSLEDVITQFEIAFVGEDKIISKIRRADIAYHAQRALQELSFDTLKSVKAYQIDVPPSLVMPLPHDYVNYTKLSWVDSAGIKHPLYPTSNTSNPFQIRQEEDGIYSFPEDNEEVKNGDFSDTLSTHWQKGADVAGPGANPTIFNKSEISAGKLTFSHRTRGGYGAAPGNFGHVLDVYQELDVSDQDFVNLSGDGESVDIVGAPGILRLGLSTIKPDSRSHNYLSGNGPRTTNYKTDMFDLSNNTNVKSYIEWNTLGNDTSKTLSMIDVSAHDTVYVIVISYNEFYSGTAFPTLTATNNIDNVSVTNSYASEYLSEKLGNEGESSTWKNFKSHTSNTNNQDDYEDDTYRSIDGNRYGLDPQNAQVNGSFYIDQRIGKIHFSSNISSKTVILDYISDSLGTDEEMQVHKFAEEAMYKHIAYAILATRANTPEYLVQRFKKERFATTRVAKLRLSNIKLEELTQTLRGKSKQIKH